MNESDNNETEPQGNKPPAPGRATLEVKTHWRAPLPPPNILAGYDKVVPGAADRILKMGEKEQSQRHQTETVLVSSNTRNEFWGMIFAFILTLVVVGLGVFMIKNGQTVAGIFGILGPVVFHAGNYSYNRYRERELRQPKQE